MSPQQASFVRKAFIIGTGAVLALYLILQAWGAIGDKGPATRIERLMSGIGAELVDQPMTPTQREYPLELGPDQRFDLRQLPQDTLIFLNFWATWCKPCRDELPSMMQLRQRLEGRRFQMVGVSYDPAWEDIHAFFDKLGGGTPATKDLLVLRDPAGEREKSLRESFGTGAIPDTYVIYNGVVLSRFVDVRDWTDPAIVEYFQRLAPTP